MDMDQQTLREFLEKKTNEYNQSSFVERDPVSIPRLFTKKQDIEIAGLFAAVFSWGNRPTIIRKAGKLMELMDHAPHEFCLHHEPADLKSMLSFKHRTFNPTDLLYFISFFRHHYHSHDSLETAFSQWMEKDDPDTGRALNGFHHYFFSHTEPPARTRKHIASPASGSTCKRLNMFLRWMVRKDNKGVDLGIWSRISPSQLVCPVDVHVARVSRKLNLLERRQTDWRAALELTAKLKELDPLDPVKYDLGLFGLGVMEKF